MAKNRKDQSATIRFGPALKAFVLCLLIAGSALGYVWQKSQVHQLGNQIKAQEGLLAQLKQENQARIDLLAKLQSPVQLDLRARSLGLGPAQPGQVIRLPDVPVNVKETQKTLRLLAGRTAEAVGP
jgi:cell division protein FtsB